MSPSPEHLLVVDDDREIRHLLTEYLTQAGFRVTTVGDGKAMRRALETGGVGLGLAIVRQIAQNHGGRIGLKNPPSGGLQARLWLPLRA